MNTPNSLLQLFDPASSTYTYLLWDDDSKQAVIIDPVDEQLQRDLAHINNLGLSLRWIVETHAHADHITAASALIELTGAQAATPAGCGVTSAAIQLLDQQVLSFGSQVIKALHTPGHTAGSMSFIWNDEVFTGDTLLINGCGRTDFQSGSASQMYHSLTQVLFKLPAHMRVWPGHDYRGQQVSTIGHEQQNNARLWHEGRLRTENEFVALMNALNLAAPRRLHEAVPANLVLGAKHNLSQDIQQAEGYAGDVPLMMAYAWWQSGQALLVDIRTNAERAWVGFIPDALAVEYKHWPGMAVNAHFIDELKATSPPGKKLLMLCRSGVRSIPAARAAQAAGFEAFNVLEGFEGDANANSHRNQINGWRMRGLPWRLG
jgi:sulfur dioxygenase